MEYLILEEFMELNRNPSLKELRLIRHLVQLSKVSIPMGWEEELQVSSMSDGGMGSLKLFPKNAEFGNRKFGKQVSEVIFKDIDGVDVIATLYLDENMNLYELDMWKTDFSSLHEIPDHF